jgi:hypothetical protein
MPRKPTETVQVNLRVKEALRRRLAAAAAKREVSLNYEMTSRLEASFENTALRSLEAIAADIEHNWLRFGARFLTLELADDLKRAIAERNEAEAMAIVKALIASPEPSP